MALLSYCRSGHILVLESRREAYSCMHAARLSAQTRPGRTELAFGAMKEQFARLVVSRRDKVMSVEASSHTL